MKRIAICADGTWNTPTQTDGGKPSPTNVWKMHCAIEALPVAPDGVKQVSRYHDGVGTHPKLLERVVNRIRMLFTRKAVRGSLWQGITGEGLDDIIMNCYELVMKEYEPGDQIFLFGFSRGAYTVRSLAGFIRKCGLLKKGKRKDVEAAFHFYRSGIKPTDQPAIDFRKANSWEVNVTCIGVWDTVGALGIPLGGGFFRQINAQHQFHDVTLSSHVKFAYHALAIDERRVPFEPTLWEQQPGARQELEQAWFVGSHSNVGGGYADTGLSDVTFLWMQERVARAGLALDPAYVAKHIGPGKWDGILVDSMGAPFDVLGQRSRAIAAPRADDAGNLVVTIETLDDTARIRFGKKVLPDANPYAPANLADYLDRFPMRPRMPQPALPLPIADTA